MTMRGDTLVLAWGNTARRDDGLGPELAARLEAARPPGVDIESDLQLHPEHAADVAEHRRVVFVDAERGGSGPFSWTRLEPSDRGLSFTTHSVSPGALLRLAADLFDARPEAWVLGIGGEDFGGFGEGLSEAAATHLEEAHTFLTARLARTTSDGAPDPEETR